MADYQKAEELRKAEQFAEAEPLFAELWIQSRHRMSGWRYAFCLRKQGKFDEALEVAQTVVEQLPEDQWSKNELIRALYDARIKPAKEQADLFALIEAADEAVRLGASELSLKLIVFAVMDVAKGYNKWGIVAEWCDRLNYSALSAESTLYGDHQMMSDRERWFYARIKAAKELKQWETVRTLGLAAKEAFPRRKDFARWAAEALSEQGEFTEAVDELLILLKQGRPEWYLYHDLAVCEARAGDNESALRHACEAALAHGEDKAKVQLYSFLARLWREQDKLALAAQVVTLARLVREREGWSIPAGLQQLEGDIKVALAAVGQEWPELPSDPRRLERALHDAWQRGVETGVPLAYGTILRLPPDKDFGFIRREDGAGDVYFKRREAPAACLREGQRVAFVVEPAFDAKKQQETVRAVKIRPA